MGKFKPGQVKPQKTTKLKKLLLLKICVLKKDTTFKYMHTQTYFLIKNKQMDVQMRPFRTV